MLKNSIRNINNRLDETSPKVYSHQDWDHNNYNFDSEHFNYDNFEVAPIEDEQSAYLSMCALANYSAGAVSSLGSLDAGSVQNVNLAGVNQHKACLSSIGSTMESTLQNMGNALNVRYTAEMENQGLFGGEPGQVLDLAGYLRGIADENSSDILDQIAGFGQQTGEQGGYQPQYDESVFTDPAKLSSTYQEIAGRDPSTWSEEDKYVIMAYYNDLAGRTAAAKAKADEAALYSYDTFIWDDYNTLKAEQNRMEKMLKANGMMEYSDWEKGWQDIKAAGKALVSEGADVIGAIKDGDWKGAWQEFTEFNTQLAATGAVVTESTVSGVLKIGEYIQDGTVMALTTVASLPTAAVDYFAGTDYTGQMNDAMMDFVARDRVGEAREWFYEGTPIGQYINDQSTLKWDSAGSQLIQDASEKAGEVAIITAATVASGGTAAPLLAGVGFLKGSGEEAERRYNLTDENGNYTNRTWKDTGLSYLSGLAEAAEWYGTSQAIGSAVQGINAVKQAGFDGIKQMVSSGIAGKTPGEIARTAFRGAKNSLLEADTWIDVGTGLVDFVVDGVNTGEWHWGSLAVDTALNLGGNMLGGSAGEMLGGGHGRHPDLDIDATPKLAVDASPSHVDDAFGGKPFDSDATLDPWKIDPEPALPDVDATPKIFGDSDSTASKFGVGPTPKLAGDATPPGSKPFDPDATPKLTLDSDATPKLTLASDATPPGGKPIDPDATLPDPASTPADPSSPAPRKKVFDMDDYRDDLDVLREMNEGKFDGQTSKLAKRWGVSKSEAEEIVSGKLKSVIEEGEFGIRKKSSTIERILDSGGFQNQFQSGTSGGLLDFDTRIEVEEDIMGISRNLDPADRPVYGMLFPKLETQADLDYYIEGPGAWYSRANTGNNRGCICIIDKAKVIDNATVSIGDSLDYDSRLVATPAANPKYSGGFGDNYSDLGYGIPEATFLPKQKFPTVESVESAKIPDLFPGQNSDTYLEIQLHGKDTHSVDIIKEILFIDPPSPSLIDKMTQKGIPWRVLT